MNNFATRLKYLRETNNLSQRELSRKADIVRSCISKMEHGQIMPSANNLIKLANFFKISTDWILSREPMFRPGSSPKKINEQPKQYNPEKQSNLPSITDPELQLIKNFKKLSPAQQKEVISFVKFKLGNPDG